MTKLGLGLDYNNICKDYNTVYLDRDNDDPATIGCMKSVLKWFDVLLSEMIETFDYKIYRMNQDTPVELSEIVKKRFFFYSLEKEIIAQTFILQKEPVAYANLAQWEQEAQEAVMIQNDDEGEGVYFYFNENSEIHKWIVEKLADCSVDDVEFPSAQNAW